MKKKRNLCHHFSGMNLRFLALMLLILSSVGCALADVGNLNRYSSGSDVGGGDDDLGALISLIYLFVNYPALGAIIFLIVIIVCIVAVKKNKVGGIAAGTQGSSMSQGVRGHQVAPVSPAVSQAVAEQIRAIDPNFSADKFTAWAREVFIKIQEAWSQRDWKRIRPFESESLFSQHNSQLEEYIRNNKINVIEKIGIKECSLKSFALDGDKEVAIVQLSAAMRDYVVDATTFNVLESNPNIDWIMNYEMVFIRKKGVKTEAGISNKSTTNCPNCGAPTEITSAGQCEYCGSVITTGEHDWVLNDIRSIGQ